jgi:hypothetical protein
MAAFQTGAAAMKVLWLLLMCGAAQAQEWIELGRNASSIAYTPAGPVQKAPSGKPAVWLYLDYSKPQANGALTTRFFLEMDCINLQVRTLSASTHSGRGATGTILDTIKAGEWEPIPPNTFALSAWMRACGK